MKFLNHIIFRAYIAKARNEHFTKAVVPDAEESLRRAYEGKFKPEYAELNYDESPELIEVIEKVWKKTSEQIFEAKVISSPGRLENVIICNELRRRFDLSQAKQFKNGELVIPRYCSFLVPKYEGNLITEMLFYRIKGQKIERMKNDQRPTTPKTAR